MIYLQSYLSNLPRRPYPQPLDQDSSPPWIWQHPAAWRTAQAANTDLSSAYAYLEGDQLVRLDGAIERYENIAREGGWALIETGKDKPLLMLGSRHPDVRLIRKRLDRTGDVRHEMGADPIFFDASHDGTTASPAEPQTYLYPKLEPRPAMHKARE